MSTYLKAEKVVATGLGLLVRQITLPQLVWRDAAIGDATMAKNDTVSIRLPAYAPARTRVLRGGRPLTVDELFENKVDVTLDTDVYKRVNIDDEHLTLDIADFGAQVLNPIMGGIVEQLEQEVADVITGATYAQTLTHTAGTDDPYGTVVAARARLNGAFVPFAGRAIVTGSDFESELLTSDKFVNASASGSTNTLREAQIGRVAGFDVYSSPALPPDEAYAFHRTAYAMVQRAPVVPDGAPWGAVQSYQGLAIRAARVFDPNNVRDQFVANSYVGADAVTDTGRFDADPAAGGRFTPVEDPANPVTGQTNAWENDVARVVRAVKITVV